MTFAKMDLYLTDILSFKKVDISTNSYLWNDALFLLNSILASKDSHCFREDWMVKSQMNDDGKKTLGKEIWDIENQYALKIQAYMLDNQVYGYGENILVEKNTLEFDVLNDCMGITNQLILIRGFSTIDALSKNQRFLKYLSLLQKVNYL
ncbi:hypothetical protein [Enterococcus rivorum]|nr:hypothetical protein [Enterococcus rivorum]